MNTGILVVFLLFSGIVVATAQDALFQNMMLMNMLRSQGGSGGYKPGAQSSSSGGASSNRSSGLGGNSLIRMMMLSGQMGDSVRDMFMCSMIPLQMRRLCLARGGLKL